MKIQYVTMNKREALTIIVASVFAGALTGAAICAALMIALTSKKPVNDDIMTSERAKGMLMKISASPARCQQWQQRARKAVCEE